MTHITPAAPGLAVPDLAAANLREACKRLRAAAGLLNAGRARIVFDDPMDMISARAAVGVAWCGISIETTARLPVDNCRDVFVAQEVGDG